MALCLGESLVECRGFDPKDQMERYVRWWDDGYLSSTGRCFDIGITVSGALSRYLQTGEPFAGSTDPHTAGNGSLMRLAPIPLAFRAKSEQALWYAGESSRTTHGAPAAIEACKFYAALILAALSGASKEEILSPTLYHGSLVPEIHEIADGSYKQKNPPAIAGTGLRGQIVGSRALGVLSLRHIRKRRALGSEPGRRCRYNRGCLRATRWCYVWSRQHPGKVA
jgi:ADP-ribosyl-[dinitrogen reductase] hydrolase